jgi:1-acyl-sn-glycerol-3-phosphate acyltransferase
VLFTAILVITLFLGYFSLQTSFDSDIRHINHMTDSQREDMALLATLSEDVPAELADMIPTAAVQQQRLHLWNAFCQRHPHLTDEVRDEAVRQGFRPDAFAPFYQLVDSKPTVQPADYFEPVGQFLGGQHLLNAKNVGDELVAILSSNFNYVSFVCGFVVFFFLWLSFGSIELALLSFLPLAVGWIWILGLMQLFGIQFNIVNIILATFIFGQGDDYTIFMTEGLVYEYATGRRRLQSYRRSVMLSAVLMFIGIGTLILAKHPALRSLAEITIIGMGTVVLMANCLPPMVFRWLVRGARRSEQQSVASCVSYKLPITLRRVAYSLFAIGFFLTSMYLFVLPYTWLYFHVGKSTEARKLKYHQLLQRLSRFVIHHVPGVQFCLQNRIGETFEQPAVVISNHQSHLDLMCLMMLTPKIVFLTNDWVWHNPFYGMVIHRAEFYPVSDGIEHHVDQLRSLYERGYSICVFPEGTRSADCSILRFHQGAFYLAEQLGADILPVYLHGVGHVLPKNDFLLREGRIDVEVGQRIATPQQPLLAFAKQLRHHYQAHYQEMCQLIETEEYWRPYRRYIDRYTHGYDQL